MIDSTVPHLPCLRLGKPYRSLNQSEVIDYRDGSIQATLSQVNAGVMRRDLKSVIVARDALQEFSTLELIARSRGGWSGESKFHGSRGFRIALKQVD